MRRPMVGRLFRLSIVETRLLTKGFGGRTGGFSFPNDLLLWWWRLFGSFLSEWKRKGVVFCFGELSFPGEEGGERDEGVTDSDGGSGLESCFWVTGVAHSEIIF